MPVLFLDILDFYNDDKLMFHIFIIYILLYLKESNLQVLFLYKIPAKKGKLFCFFKQRDNLFWKNSSSAGTGSTELLGPFCLIFLPIFYFSYSDFFSAFTARKCGLLFHFILDQNRPMLEYLI